jgi:hypothetical protein
MVTPANFGFLGPEAKAVALRSARGRQPSATPKTGLFLYLLSEAAPGKQNMGRMFERAAD